MDPLIKNITINENSIYYNLQKNIYKLCLIETNNEINIKNEIKILIDEYLNNDNYLQLFCFYNDDTYYIKLYHS